MDKANEKGEREKHLKLTKKKKKKIALQDSRASRPRDNQGHDTEEMLGQRSRSGQEILRRGE